MSGERRIDLNQSVYAICQEHPEAVEILRELGFHDIAIPGMLQTAGRFMTIGKGAQLKKIDMALIAEKFRERGYQLVEGGQP